jgi:methionyl-tRNA formyltransferase
MDEGMDTGPILLQSPPVPIAPEDTAGDLATRLAPIGAELLIETLARLDTLTPRPQRNESWSMSCGDAIRGPGRSRPAARAG